MHVDLRETQFGSTGSVFPTNTMQSMDTLKIDEDRLERRASTFTNTHFRLRAISRVTWGSVFRGLRAPKEQVSVMVEFQQRLHLNSDTVVAVLELAIILLSCVQLEVSSRSPRWRENKVCGRLANCVGMEDEGSFKVPNCIRGAIGLLGILRLWVRIRFLLKQRNVTFEGISWIKRTAACRMYIWEFLGIAVFPYPGLEIILDRNQADIMVLLSIAVGVRSICWRHIMYFPYPIRQKSKVASFAGNLEFSYREFVFKKVMDDHPLRKIVLVSVILLIFTTFLVRAIETINCVCTPFAEFALATSIDAHHLNCVAIGWGDAIWLVSTSFVMLGFGDVVPRSKTGRSVIVVSACVMRLLAAMLASVVIKKSNFSTMEARVHAFLFRMDLFNKKDLSAVMAVQASFRFAKSYRRSLKWHKHQNSLLYYRPLSARLPNEVKKKLYVSRFQASLKDIMKFNTDGDPMNAFAKHIEVITAALGITLVEMAQLKKVYWRKNRLFDEKQKAADQSAMSLLTASPSLASPPTSPRQSECHMRISAPLAPAAAASGTIVPSASSASIAAALATPLPAPVPTEWGLSMVSRCEKVLAELYQIEQSAKSFRAQDRRSSIYSRSTRPTATVQE